MEVWHSLPFSTSLNIFDTLLMIIGLIVSAAVLRACYLGRKAAKGMHSRGSSTLPADFHS
ncbi:MAG TPA: hypothetical protein DCF33_09545 [Saprospirales bacterium]|nr:hypothetical protein [Saprospirales bacterium]